MIVHRAPGKLFIAGEYAIIAPGQPAVLVAVDRFVSVEVEPVSGDGVVTSAYHDRESIHGTASRSQKAATDRLRSNDYVVATIAVVDALAAARSVATHEFDVTITSDLEDENRKKFGLGSSAAVVTALVSALDELYALDLSEIERYKLAMIATLEVSPQASGGDVAASTFHGWIMYASPDREWVSRMFDEQGVEQTLQTDWPGLEIRRLPSPKSVGLVVGWTGDPVSTAAMVADLYTAQSSSSTLSHFLELSRKAVERLVRGINRDDSKEILSAVDDARGALDLLDASYNIGIETPKLRMLRQIADHRGARAKTSGAGGGDCGIVLTDSDADIPSMLKDWKRQGVTHLSVSVYQSEGVSDD